MTLLSHYNKRERKGQEDMDIHIHILGNMACLLLGQVMCRLGVMMERHPSLVDFNTLGSPLCFQSTEARERSEIQK
jgi:hypothetical protein